MGASESTTGPPQHGYHVLQVQPGSPGERAGLLPFFDFIVAAAGIPMTREDSQFVDILKTNVGKEVKLIIFNIKTEKPRDTVIIPSDSWGGAGLAGISIRFAPIEHATERVWHVLDVYPDSPASAAGLEPRTDYIVGTPELLLSDSEDFFTLVASNEGKNIPLYVYSANTDNIRLAHITPNSRWGGTGSLGCDIGYGYLHRIPMNRNIPQTAQPTQTIAPPGRAVPQHPQPTQPHVQQPVAQVQPVINTGTYTLSNQPQLYPPGFTLSNTHAPASQQGGVPRVYTPTEQSPPLSPITSQYQPYVQPYTTPFAQSQYPGQQPQPTYNMFPQPVQSPVQQTAPTNYHSPPSSPAQPQKDQPSTQSPSIINE